MAPVADGAPPARASGTVPQSGAAIAPSTETGKSETSATEPANSDLRLAGGLARGTTDLTDRALYAGDQAYFADELPRAKTEYQRAARLNPQDPAPKLGLIRIELAQTNVPTDYAVAPKDARVLSLWKRLEELHLRFPDYGPAEVERGRVLLILGRAEPALSALQRGVELDPSDPEAHSALGVALLATGKPAEALPRFRRAAELDPRTADRFRNLGTACLLLGQVKDAISAYQRAVALAPDDPRAHSDLGTAYLANNTLQQALPELRRAVDLDPSRATFRSNLAYAALQMGDFDRAIDQAQEATRLDPKLGSGFINLGIAQARKGLYDDAERSLRRALALDPTDPRAKANLEELAELRKKNAK